MKIAFRCLLFSACLAAAAAGCGDTESPVAPSSSPAAGGVSPLGAPPLVPVSTDAAGVSGGGGGGIDHLAPGGNGFNAYDFFAGYDGGMLSLALVEDEMRSMREASKPHRMRRVTVGHCPVEPHHALQSCGTALWTGRVRLAGRVELDPIALPACEGWVVVHADELFDDVRDGWRNAPCPAAGGGAVGSDGSGDGWPDYPKPEQPEQPEETVQSTVDATISAAGGLVAGRGQLDVVHVLDLFEGTEGTDGDDYRPASSDPTVATVEMTNNPRVRVTPVGAGTATIEVVFLKTGARAEFSVTVSAPPPTTTTPAPAVTNGPPVITDPGAMTFFPGETITSFPVTVTDPDGADTVTVTVEGLPDGLTWSGGMVSGTVSSSAAGQGYPAEQDYTVAIEATDGVNEPVTASFTIKVITTWILLVDSFDAARNLGRTGAGPDAGNFSLRWVRWYYDASDPTTTITQAYADAGFHGGGTDARGCRHTGPPPSRSPIHEGARRPNETDYTTGTGTRVLTPRDHANSRLPVRRLDSNGNEIPRVRSGYGDTNINLWTVSFTRTSVTRFTTLCTNNAGWTGDIYYTDVPLPPTP